MLRNLQQRLAQGDTSDALPMPATVPVPMFDPQSGEFRLGPGAGAELLVDVENVAVSFPGGMTALRALNFKQCAGEFVSIVGPSGCGKSTLLRLVSGLIEPTSGRIAIGGQPPRAARRQSQDTAFVFQQPALLPWRSVLANVELPLELQGIARSRRRELATMLLDRVGLGDATALLPHQLSGGMKMRASVARALVTRPDVLLLDEPFGALDDITRQRLNEELLTLWQRDRFTALFVTHNVFEAVFLSQRVVVMSSRPGRVLDEIVIDEAYPRGPAWRATPKFAETAGRISEALRAASGG